MSLDTKTLGLLFQLSRDAVVGIRNHTVVFANPAAEELLSIHEGDNAARCIPEHLLTDPSERFIATMTRGGKPYGVSVLRQGALSILSIAPIRSDTETFPVWNRAIFSFGSDLLTARLAIDAIVGGARDHLSEKQRLYASALYQSYYRMKRLHDHMILAGNLLRGTQPFRKQLVSLGELCRDLCDTVEPLIRPLGLTLTFSDECADSCVNGDPTLLETMLLNLVANSLQHTASGGNVKISLTGRGKRCIIAISDDGCGISPACMAAIFNGTASMDMSDPNAGAGLGLLIARGIAELHGGTLIMESREDEGTALRISLPLPLPSQYLEVHQPETTYRTDGMNAVLTELSVALDKSVYDQRLFD